MSRRKTAFDRFVSEQDRDPAFAASRRAERAKIDEIDEFVRGLERLGVLDEGNRGEFARRLYAQPELLRALAAPGRTKKGSATSVAERLAAFAESLGFTVRLEPKRGSRAANA